MKLPRPRTTADLLTAVRRRDTAALGALMAPDVAFHSPVASYRGREVVVHLLDTIGGVLDELRPVRRLDASDERVTFLAVRVGDAEADGVLAEVLDADGRVGELRLLLRPLPVLLAAVERMGAALAAAPIPRPA
jgi:hypothetical protein